MVCVKEETIQNKNIQEGKYISYLCYTYHKLFPLRIKTELMCQMSNMENNSNLFLICATNCPWDLDSAFMRRFQKRIYTPLPSFGERYELLALFTKNTPLDIDSEYCSHVIERTDGYSGSDLSNVVQYAINIPIFELEDTKIWKLCADGFYEPISKKDNYCNMEEIVCSELSDLPPCSVRARNVDPLDLVNALESVKMTVSKDDIKKYSMFEADQNEF